MVNDWYIVVRTEDSDEYLVGIFADPLVAQKFICTMEDQGKYKRVNMAWWELTRLVMDVTMGKTYKV
jgi:hypothetical protein